MKLFVFVGVLVILVQCVACDDDWLKVLDSDDFDDDGDEYEAAEDTHNSGERLLNHILSEVDKGHVTHERISHWMSQIKVALDDGELTQAQVDEFNATMRTKLAATSDSGTCCPFG